ncbi:cellulase-like family protein [Myceligenerans pegani]|uniref:Sugar-binding cellulase-like protein n=1 Tax=Myceligenerans pegani TaxID=2776917 RepID=A0ABR9N4G4_9MICO|nr:cellulase-like family protein [Myceligenerans sp. TRM 65318]MBE1878565.1 hypothetical protein [Myceligenerans sp. TRM 65318]MBE3020836.1 hypothetical protein [Myceligenerans sp. TRM 65318]
MNSLFTTPDRPHVVSLWDFTWYTRTGPGEPFEDLDRAFAEARERGYDTIRICAMPFLLFRSGIDTSALGLGPLGGEYGQRTRWYDVRHETTIDARAHLVELFRAADRHDVGVIASSWEYQQSPSFAATPEWYEALHAVDPEERAVVLADAHADLVDLLESEGLGHRLLLTELHNEVQIGYLTDGLDVGRGDEAVRALTPRLERGIARFRQRHPDRPVTVNYAGVPIGALNALPADLDALVVHPYVYGVLQELIDTFGLRGPADRFDEERARELLRQGAPGLAAWSVPAGQEWRTRATIMSPAEVYVHDWCDPEAWDRWLYDRWGTHRVAMYQKLTLWLEAAADAAVSRGIPLILGEGYVGYTPLHGRFEEDLLGAGLCRHAMREARRLGAWGAVVCSNAAPHHPMWTDVALQRQCAEILTGVGHPAPVH